MPTHKEKKSDQNNSKKPSFTNWSKPSVYVPVAVSSWSSTPEICFEGGLSLDGDDGGGSADDEDNLAYAKIVESVKHLSGAEPSVSVFRFSQSFPGGVHASWRVMNLEDNLFLSFSKAPSFNKECFISLLEYAEDTLHCKQVYVLLPKLANHAHRSLLQSFRFMGFQLLHPSSPVASSVVDLCYIALCYDVDSDSDNDDD